MSALVVHCSCPDAETATRIADALVGERLAACVQVIPSALSVYRWQGEVQRAQEALLSIKTTRARLAALAGRLRELHPYELPEIVALEVVDGLPEYLEWIATETAPP